MAESPLEAQLAWQVKLAGLPTPQREARFHPTRRWRLDFYWAEQQVACEVDGATWSHGRHARGAGIESDCEKYAEALLQGIRVLRVTAKMIEAGSALAYLQRLLTP